MNKRADQRSPLCYFVPKQQKGQFYLIAAIVLVAIILGFVTVKNYSRKSSTKVYDLGDELGIESYQVVEYGIINEEMMDNLMINFTEKYSQYLQGDIDNLFFIFGNFDEVKVVTYREVVQGGISLGGIEIKITKDETFVYTPPIETNAEGIKTIKVEIGKEEAETKYEFELKPGENFYYIMQKAEEGQEFSIDNSKVKEKKEKNEKKK